MTSRNLVTTRLKELKIKFFNVKFGQDREISKYHYNPIRGPVSRKGLFYYLSAQGNIKDIYPMSGSPVLRNVSQV